jgi:tRNA modification GTPase
MEFFYDDNTPIIACSSGNSSNTGISLIRISGFDEPSIFSSVLNIDFSSLKYRYSYYSELVFHEHVIDSVIAVFFKGPNSFNGENILELSVHGNILNVERIINFFIDNFKFRLSSPGEFTYRAYKNKKLNLK